MHADDMKVSMEDLNLTEEELEEYDQITPSRGRITYSNASIDIAGLVNRLRNNDIVIPRIGKWSNAELVENIQTNPFQRGFVWSNKQMDSFIESMLLGYPTPSLFLVSQNDGRMLVLDGQQRLETLRAFYDGIRNERSYKLSLKGSQYDQATYRGLEPDARRFLDNTPLSVTVIRLEERPNAVEAVYDVFSRLNGGGTKLTPHEIRMALYNGPFMEALDEINQLSSWRQLYGAKPNKRFRDHELILRIIALYENGDEYKKPLGTFLNKYSERHREDSATDMSDTINLFKHVADIYASIGQKKLFSTNSGNQINVAKADSLMVGGMRFLSQYGSFDKDTAIKALKELDNCSDYSDSITESTSDDLRVRSRISCVLKRLQDARQ